MEIVNFKALIIPGRYSHFNAFLSQLFQGLLKFRVFTD